MACKQLKPSTSVDYPLQNDVDASSSADGAAGLVLAPFSFFDALPDNLIASIAVRASSDDACRLLAVSKRIRDTFKPLITPPNLADVPDRPRGLHFWGCLERRYMSDDEIRLRLVKPWDAAFKPEAGAAQLHAQPQEQQQGQDNQLPEGFALAADLVALAADLAAPQQQLRRPLMILTAAGLIGSWWGETAEQDAGGAAGQAMAVITDCLGADITPVMRALLSHPECPAAAGGYWGVMFLGLLLSTTAVAAPEGGLLLVQHLLGLSVKSGTEAVPVPAPYIAPGEPTSSETHAKERWLYSPPAFCVKYHVQEFLAAVLLLLKTRQMRSTTLEGLAVQELLQYHITKELRWHECQEQDAAASFVQGDGVRQEWDVDPDILRQAGLPSGARLTGEQLRFLRFAQTSFNDPNNKAKLVINDAKAGAAKSFTLKVLTLLCKNKRFLMTAFNRPIVDQAKMDAPPNVVCSTTHVLAGSKREELLDRGWKLQSRLNVNDLWIRLLPQLPYYQQLQGGPPLQVAVVIREVLELFCTSADDVISSKHLPKQERLPHLEHPPDYVQVAQELWQCYQTDSFPVRRSESFTFNMYLKMFTMDLVNGRGELRNGPYDVILVDEAQDINPVTLQLLMSQLPRSVLVLVGDKHQHIYTFNNCCNALAQAEALQAGSPWTVRHFSLSSSFRLGPAVSEVVNRVLWQLGERRHFVVPAGFKHAAVYRAVAPPAAVNDGGDDVDLVPAPAAAACFEWVPVLGERNPLYTSRTPQQLEAVNVQLEVSTPADADPDADGIVIPQHDNVALALPPVDPGTGRRFNLKTLTRYNKTWVDLAFALPASLPAIEAAGGPVKLFLLAQNSWDSAVQYLDTVRDVYKLVFDGVPFRGYHTAEDLQNAVEAREDQDLAGALHLVKHYQHQIPELIQATLAAKVATKQAAHYLLGTCHKAKGTEEDYVQLADDFESIRCGGKPPSDVAIDEYNLTYVAASRAKVALVLNRDLEKLLHPERQGQLLLQAQVMGAAQLQQDNNAQAAQHVGQKCAMCSNWIVSEAGQAVGTRTALRCAVPLAVALRKTLFYQPVQVQEHSRALCCKCFAGCTIWGQLLA